MYKLPKIFVFCSITVIVSAFSINAQANCNLELPQIPDLFKAQSITFDQATILEANFKEYSEALNQQVSCLENAQTALSRDDENFEQVYFLYEDIKIIAESTRSALVERYNFLLANKVEAEKKKKDQL